MQRKRITVAEAKQRAQKCLDEAIETKNWVMETKMNGEITDPKRLEILCEALDKGILEAKQDVEKDPKVYRRESERIDKFERLIKKYEAEGMDHLVASLKAFSEL